MFSTPLLKNTISSYGCTFLSFQDFHKRKPAQDKKVNDVIKSGRELVDENIVPTEKREKVELDLQSFPDTWNNLVDKADESRKAYVFVVY